MRRDERGQRVSSGRSVSSEAMLKPARHARVSLLAYRPEQQAQLLSVQFQPFLSCQSCSRVVSTLEADGSANEERTLVLSSHADNGRETRLTPRRARILPCRSSRRSSFCCS